MAGKISELPAASSLSGTEQVEVLQGGVNKRAALSLLPQPTAQPLAVHKLPWDIGQVVASTSAFKYKGTVLQATSAATIRTIWARYSYSTTATNYDLQLVKGTVSGGNFTVTDIIQTFSFVSVTGGTNGNMSVFRGVLTSPQAVANGDAFAVVFSQNGAAANFATRIAASSTNNNPEMQFDPWPVTGTLSACRTDAIAGALAVGSVIPLVAGGLLDAGFQVSVTA